MPECMRHFPSRKIFIDVTRNQVKLTGSKKSLKKEQKHASYSVMKAEGLDALEAGSMGLMLLAHWYHWC